MPSGFANALIFIACGMIWNAARLFHSRNVLWTAMLAGAAVWMLACTTVPFPPMGANRIMLASLIVSTYTFLTAAELWRERRKALMRRWPALFVPALHGAVFLFPIPIASLMPHQSGLVTLAAGWLSIFVLEMLLYAVGAAFIVLVLTKERTLRTHKTAALTDPLTGLFNRRGLIEATRELTADHARRAGLVVLLDRLARALARHQQPSGGWATLVNRPTYVETSGTCLVAYALATGTRRGWLHARQTGY